MTIELHLNASEGIKLDLPLSLDSLTYYHLVNICYYSADTEAYIGSSILFDVISDLEDACASALDNKREIPEQILVEGLGYHFNMENESISQAYTNENEPYINPYNDCGVWLRDYLTFLYNVNGDIYFEISPSYDSFEEEEEKVPFEKWISDFKPLSIIHLDKNKVEELLKMCSYIKGKAQNIW
jgi:hypothetical protein